MTRLSPTTSLRRAFTLIELLVVMAIIIVLVSVGIPAINAMTKGNDVAQTQNMLSSLIANTRAIAISQGRMAALVLYEEGSGQTPPHPAPQTSAMYLVEDRDQTGVAPGFVRFWPTPNAIAQRLPVGARVASFSSTAVGAGGTSCLFVDPINQEAVAVGTNYARVIIFDNSGQLVLRSGIAVDTNATDMTKYFNSSLTGAQQTAWKSTLQDFYLTDLAASTPGSPNANTSVSTAALAVVGDVEYRRDNPQGTPPIQINQWIVQHAKVLTINNYTGTVIQ